MAKNEERSNKLEKGLLTAAGVFVGAAFLHKGGATKEISKAIGDISETMSKVYKDVKLAGRKNLDAEKITDIFKRRISNDDSTFKIARKTAPKLNLKRHGVFKDLLSIDKLEGEFRNIRNKRFDAQLQEDIMNAFNAKFKDLKERDKDFMKNLHNLAERSLRRKDVFFEQGEEIGTYKAITKEFKKAVKGSNLEGHEDEIANVLKDALEKAEEMKDSINSLDSNIKNEIKDKYVKGIKEKYKRTKTAGDRAATVEDIYKALQEEKAIARETFDEEMNNFLDEVKSMIDKDKDIGNLVVDSKRYRMDSKNNFYSIEDLRRVEEKAKEAFSETIPGKLFGVKNFIEESKAPNFYYMAKGTYDPGLAKLQGGENLLKEELLYIGDRFYKFGEKGLEHFKEADDRVFISGKSGSKFGLIDRMAGNVANKNQPNELLKALDINTKGGNAYKELLSMATKFFSEEGENWERNVSKRILNDYSPLQYSSKDVRDFYNDLRAINDFYNGYTKTPTYTSIEKLKGVLSDDAVKILNSLESEDPLLSVMSIVDNNLINGDLKTLYNKISKDPDLRDTITRTSPNKKNVIKYNDILTREIVKEALFKDIADNRSYTVAGYSTTLSKLEKLDIGNNDLSTLKDIMNWGIIQEKGGLFSRDAYRAKTLAEKENAFLNISSLINGENSNAQENYFLESFRNSIEKITKDNSSLFDKIDVNENINTSFSKPQWMTVKKSTSVLDIIESINNDIKNTDGEVKNFVRQFLAGRNNMDEVTSMTMLPYHMLNRLMTPLESLGFGLSNNSTGSTLDLAQSIALKRILPVAAVGFGLSYLNYESENFTGTSLNEAFQNAKATFGVGVKTLASPFDNYLKRQNNYNPISDYLFGEYKDKEEYLDYLENGYDPVRKGRFWSFGSASEFRGGKISYWEPNKLRQAHSNYRDISIYGSSEEKWKHSIIPTPRHPLSTIRYLMNPYWLEDKHYNDRPYPVTGKMFSEGTPWGAVLNPTIGELIKPQRKMHQKELQGTLVDVRDIIRNINNDIKDRAQENRLLRIDESGFTPMAFNPASMPSMSEAIYSIDIRDGKISSAGFQGQNYAETMETIGEAVPAPVAPSGYIRNATKTLGYQKLASTNNFEDKQAAGWLLGLSSLITSNAVTGGTAVKMISEVNNEIKNRAETTQRGEWFEKANLYKNPYRKESYNKKLDYMENMIAFDTKKDYVDDMLYSGKQLSGMYGFLFEQIFPSKQSYRFEQAGKMSSFTRQFWDESIGGIGGNFMEIARRFFPHEDRSRIDINPIRNTQEEWLPERFLTGDPYSKLPKGEARLPGAGYESLNKLHSDQYGRYGAFDRYKILADIAPLSEEYKIWKKIAKTEVKDPKLKRQMEQIEERAKEQIKEHDFYNYKFIGKKMAEHNAVIKEVSNTGKFKIAGSDQEFNLAGIKVLKDEEGNSQVHNFLKPGMMVKISYEDNDFNNKDSQGQISAIVNKGGTLINKEMEEMGAAKEKDTKETLADERYNISETDAFKGHFYEAIAHAPIPFLHNKFLRIDSSLESYKKEQVYGTNYATWDHPIKGFVYPAFRQAFEASPIHQALGVGAFAFSEYMLENSDSKMMKNLADASFALINPGAFAGGVIGAIPKMSIKDQGVWNARNGARIGATIALAGYTLSNTQNPYLSSANFAALGYLAQNQLKFKGISNVQGALIGAGVGLLASSLNPEAKLTNIYERYIPDNTEKKWEIEEYYDRLEYVKYTKLFHEAAKIAEKKEGIDIHRIVNQYESNKEKNSKIIEKLEKQKQKADKMIDEGAREELITAIDQKINELLTPIQYLQGGEYTKAAIAYKKAAETTIYGLTEDSSVADVLRALPKYDRDYFLDFAKVKDPKERKKILQYVSPYKAKALQVLWGEDVDEVDSNNKFFSGHELPNMFWSGWNPNIDLEHVKMKTIENEGMMLSDFGLYESSKNEPAAIFAPEIKEINKSNNTLSLQANMLTLLNGVGFSNVDVTVESTSKPGIHMVANISRVASYNLNNTVSSVLNNFI